ncbi:hypothetical protein KJ359_001878 [Pestalotiopsis sp. 9143b]|nr:hypothetical protein KJ359_001878 [Pestalotiopsis sp. 9143b]
MSLLVGDVDPDFAPQHTEGTPGKSLPSSSFTSMLEARDDILQPTQEYLTFDKINGNVDGYLDRLGIWHQMFRDYIQDDDSSLDSPASSRSIALLKLQALFLEYSVSCFWPSDPLNPMRWDTYSDAKIEEMIRLAAIAVSVHVSGDEAIGPASRVVEPRFQLDLGVVPILWNIVDRVRAPHLRRSALRILKNAPLQEGVWNAALSSLVAERTIELEEAGLERVEFKEDIPKEQRRQSLKEHE